MKGSLVQRTEQRTKTDEQNGAFSHLLAIKCQTIVTMQNVMRKKAKNKSFPRHLCRLQVIDQTLKAFKTLKQRRLYVESDNLFSL